MQIALIIIHVIISLILIGVVLMQHGNQQGISGAIAGGAETFFGKNKGRTVDAMLKKVTAVVAFLFIVSSLVLTIYSVQAKKKAEAQPVETLPITEQQEAPAENADATENTQSK